MLNYKKMKNTSKKNLKKLNQKKKIYKLYSTYDL